MSPSSYAALEGEEISLENKALFCFARFNEVEGQRGAANNQQKIQMCKVAPAAPDDASVRGYARGRRAGLHLARRWRHAELPVSTHYVM